MKVVVTGARGYIGTELTKYLDKRGDYVVPLSRSGKEGEFVCLRTNTVGGLREHMDGADGVVHLAGRLVDNPGAPIADYLAANVALTDAVMIAAREADVEIVVHASSRLVYPRTLDQPAREVDAAPDTPYGLSKYWAEDVVRFHETSSDISALSLRIAQVTGNNHAGLGVLNQFIRQARETGMIRVTGKGTAQREIMHVLDVVAAIGHSLNYRGRWYPVNVGGVAPTTIDELARTVARQLGIDQNRVVHEKTLNEDRSSYALVQDRARELLRWSPKLDLNYIVAEVCMGRRN